MKKTLLAAALTVGFFGVAQAETSVTLYGILDGGIGYQQIKGVNSYATDRTGEPSLKAKKTGMINGIEYGNRWGLKGAEDLGNGLRAVFQLESGFDLGTGQQAQSTSSSNSDRLFGRQATIGLASDAWGQLDLGRQTNIASKYLAGVATPFGASFGQANSGAVFTQANTARYDNMVMYQTPNFSGFQFGAGYSFNVSGGESWKVDGTRNSNQHAITTGLRYGNGPIAVALTYDAFKARGSDVAPVTDDTTVKAWALAGSYDFEIVKLHAGFGQTRDGFFQLQGYGSGASSSFSNATGAFGAAKGLKFNSYSAGVSAPLGNGTLMAGWMMADPRSNPDSFGAGEDMDKQQTYSLGYTYGISKRTSLYAIGSYAKHVQFLPDAKSTLVGVGVVHKF
ncbi:porin [Pollutimonas thiosulfatoxidans]|uniref:Porin n=1 Tax=Pollutimonas thiosulfatoxidans TaxID=2028345 RepID=A0A410G912_9BURK|nr:porin [Pollutimonas thiosulfatoxidans]QAA92751.1 porin [Pollutimonas thiosulfatoxidans]